MLNDERIILAMETCDTSLGDLIEQRFDLSVGPLEPSKILKVCIDVCSALDYLHTKVHLLHGDLKSYNVLIKNAFEQCKLCDFGVSLPLNSEGFIDLDKNPNLHYIGTDIFSAPEIFHAPPEDISTKCDIFSFGLIIFECLTLRPPHYEHLEVGDISSAMTSSNDTSIMSNISLNTRPKKLFSDQIDSMDKENQFDMSNTTAASLKETTMNESQAESSISMKSTAATIGDDTIQDITGTTFNGTINNTNLNSTFNSDAENSLMEKSMQSMNDSTNTIASWYGTRPRIPEVEQFDEDYFIFCETFYLCTQALPEERPTAGDLLVSMKNVKTN